MESDRISQVREIIKKFGNIVLKRVNDDESYPKYMLEIADKNLPEFPIMVLIDRIKENKIGLSISLDACPFISASIVLALQEKIVVELLLPHYYSNLKHDTFYGTKAYTEKLAVEDYKNQIIDSANEIVENKIPKTVMH